MAKSTLDTQQIPEVATDELVRMQETLDGMQQQMMRAMTGNAELTRRWMNGWSRVAGELMDFTGNRLQETMTAWQESARCQDPGEAMRLYMSRVETTIRLSVDEAGRLYALCSETSEDCLDAVNADAVNGPVNADEASQ